MRRSHNFVWLELIRNCRDVAASIGIFNLHSLRARLSYSNIKNQAILVCYDLHSWKFWAKVFEIQTHPYGSQSCVDLSPLESVHATHPPAPWGPPPSSSAPTFPRSNLGTRGSDPEWIVIRGSRGTTTKPPLKISCLPVSATQLR
jgi:hypothetical protein